MEETQMDLINNLIRRTNCIEEKIDLIIDGFSRLPAWVDRSAYQWDNFGKNYASRGLRGIKRGSSGDYKRINGKKCHQD